MPSLTDSNLVFRALIVLGLISFGFYIAFDQGMHELMLTSDRSYISYVIIGLYLIASAHWFWLSRALSIERTQFSTLEENFTASTTGPDDEQNANNHRPQTNVREHSVVGNFIIHSLLLCKVKLPLTVYQSMIESRKTTIQTEMQK